MSQNMGLGKLGNPHTIFVRKFRFILKGKYLDGNFNASVTVNYTTKTLSFSAYELVESTDKNEIHIHKWADAMENNEYQDEELTITTFDGCGEEIYAKKFTGLNITSRINEFDYSDNNVSTHQLVLTYEKCENIPITVKPRKTEIEINHLNAKFWIPGKEIK